MINPIDFILHVDKYLSDIILNYGVGVYFISFLIIFLETGLVITPFLPGDSLLFALGVFASKGVLNLFYLFILLTLAAIIGDSVNYWMGNYFGERAFNNSKFFRKEYLEKTKKFYHLHGPKAIVLGRFIPIIRTFVPFVAGVGKMNYSKFLFYNVLGGIVWVSLFLFGGYFFGGIPFIEEHFSLVVIAIIFISILPILYELLKKNRR